MKKVSFLTAMLLATLAVAAHAGEIILYENTGLSGRQIDVRGYLPDIKAAGFNDHHASVLVKSGTWQVCADANFQGFCATLQPNEYQHLDTRFNERISSAREVGAPVAEAAPPTRERGWGGSIALFSRPSYRGRGVTLNRNMPDLDAVGFNDRASSLIVSKGTWELCSEGGYGGNCQVFEPGRYADLGPLARDISSARLLRNREPRRY